MFEFDSKYGMTQENMWTYPIGTLLKCFACIENVFNDDCFGICVRIKKKKMIIKKIIIYVEFFVNYWILW